MKKLSNIFVNTLKPAETYTHTHTHTDKPCQVKKQIGTICLVLFSIIISPVFATEITDPATCDSGTLSTDTGPTNKRANYESNTLNLKWYDDSGNQLNVPTASNSCTYGGSIIPPTPPTKRGYTFKGWKVAYDFSMLSIVSSGLRRIGKGEYLSTHGISCVSENGNGCDADFADLNKHEWKVPFTSGDTIYGISMCSSVSGTNAVAGSPINDQGVFCWCKASKYKPSNTDSKYAPLNVLSWVFAYQDTTDAYCAFRCAYNCAYYTQMSSSFRTAVYGQSNN